MKGYSSCSTNTGKRPCSAPCPPKRKLQAEEQHHVEHHRSPTPRRRTLAEDVRQFLYREARFLDDKDWDELARALCAGRGVLDAVLGR